MANNLRRLARGVVALAAVLPLTWSVSLPAQPSARPAPAEGCAVFDHVQFGGQRRDVSPGDRIAWVGPQWNDRISSVACARRCALSGYENIDFAGARQRFDGMVPGVGSFWNDRISSMRVECRGFGDGGGISRPWPPRDAGGCTLFEHAGFAGARLELRAGEELSAMSAGWNDRVSSLQCTANCEVTAFEHNDYAGAARTMRGATPTFGAAWNDRISSLRTSCR